MADATALAVGPRAGFGERLLAWLVDAVILSVVGFVLGRFGILGSLLAFAVGVGYYVYLEGGGAGQTIGKRVMNIRVVDAETGGPIDYGRAVVRYICKIISSIPCGLGYFWMLWDSNKQTWHDKLSTTVVVPTSAYPVESAPS